MATSSDFRRGRFQFRIVTLLAAMFAVGLVCVALRTPTALWSGLVQIAFLLALGTCGLLIVYREGRTRAFAAGFVVFAMGTVLLRVALMVIALPPMWSPPIFGDDLADWLFLKIHPDNLTNIGSVHESIMQRTFQPEHFKQIVECAVAALLGIIGGVIAQALYATQRRDTDERR
jgi:hypothetical protein